jgi:hypothetical protein
VISLAVFLGLGEGRYWVLNVMLFVLRDLLFLQWFRLSVKRNPEGGGFAFLALFYFVPQFVLKILKTDSLSFVFLPKMQGHMPDLLSSLSPHQPGWTSEDPMRGVVLGPLDEFVLHQIPVVIMVLGLMWAIYVKSKRIMAKPVSGDSNEA